MAEQNEVTEHGLPLAFEHSKKKAAAKMGEGEPPLTFVELKMWARLKKRLKRGPRMTRVQRADYLRRLAREMGVRAK